MNWWWMPFMALLQPAEAWDREGNADVTAGDEEERARPRAKTKRKAARKSARKGTRQAAARKGARKGTRKTAARKGAARKSAGKTRAKRRV